mgnify:CR=1 FL=1
MGGGTDINYPQQPSYGEGMADALKAQVGLLTGTGDFAETGSLESLLPLEESIRRKTAQTDTDIFRQTLLGSTTDEATGTYDDEGRLVIGYKPTSATTTEKQPYRFEYEQVDPSKYQGNGQDVRVRIYTPDGAYVGQRDFYSQKGSAPSVADQAFKASDFYQFYEDGADVTVETGEGDPSPIYAKDKDGAIITDKSKAGQSETVPASRLQDGMLDLLGDRRNVMESRRLSKDEQGGMLIDQNPELNALYEVAQNDPNNPFMGMSKAQAGRALLDQFDGNLEAIGQEFGISNVVLPEIGNVDSGRQAGFDEQGNFLGLSAYTEDIQRGNLSRQREADLADVERLAGRYSDVMEGFAPGTATGIQGARDLLEEQKEALTTGGGAIDVPTGSTYGGDTTGMMARGVTVADPLQLQASTQFDQEVGRGQDSLRSALLGDARTAMQEGLTEREQAQIADAARARSTLMGRTFDQSATIAEAEARVAEDNARRMQNRAFAQGVLGQEAGLQQGDITRGMAQESEQAGLNQRRDLAQAQLEQQQQLTELDSAQRASLANQAQRQQAGQFDTGATMDAQRLNEQLRQQGLGNYINAVGNLAQIEDRYALDPFQALLGRGGGNALQQGQSVFGQAGYGLSSGPQYLNPEAGLGYISQMAANEASMYGAQQAANAGRSSGIMGGLGALGGGLLGGLASAGKIF